MKPRQLLYAASVLALFAPAAIGQDWPQWRGPDRSGVSADTGLLDKWPDDGPPLVWTAENAGEGFGSPAIKDGRVMLLGDREDGQHAIAYDLRNGRERWARRIDETYNNRYGNGPRATPTIDGDRAYVLSAAGHLWCLNAADGEPVWDVDLVARFGGETFREIRGARDKNTIWGISESPLIEGDRIICNGGGTGGSIVALDKKTGKTVWRSEGMDDPPGYASAVAATVGGVRHIIHVTHKGAVGLRADDGKLLWRYDKAANRTANCTTPIFHDGRLFLTSAYDTGCALLKLSRDGSGVSAEEVYFSRDMMNHHGGVVLVDGHVYGFSNNNLACLDFTTGERKWQDRSVGKGSVTYADGKLICAGERGTIGLVEATPKEYREISRFSVKPRQSVVWAHPVVTGGRLYIRNGDRLLCYKLKAERS